MNFCCYRKNINKVAVANKVKYRRSLYGGSEAYLVSSGEIGLAHTYDRVSIGDNKNGSNQGTAQKAAADRRVIGSHTNPVSIMATN